jgi:membrane-bound lytic murein transglycosylase F
MRGFPPLAARAAVAVLVSLWLTYCGREPSALERIRDRGELRVVTLGVPHTEYVPGQGPQALEVELATQFATRLGVRLVMHTVATEADLLEELRSHRADVAAAHLAFDARWSGEVLPAHPYDQVRQIVVYQRGHFAPRQLGELVGHPLVVAAASPQAAILARLKASARPDLEWTELAGADPLAEVAAGRAELTVLDATDFAAATARFPALGVGFDLPERRPAQWLVGHSALDLRNAVDAFFADLESTNDLREIVARYDVERPHFRLRAGRDLVDHMVERLPGLQELFETASASTGVDWRLLAAIGYQESHWNPLATSPNGAAGIMMLMPDTADELGVEDRDDPRENIMAGARYFVQVHAMIPERIPEPDRTWLALAAYNVGFGHLEDARIITQMRGGNPDRWADVSEHLPLLADESFYPLAKRGYARGWEPVQFVERIRGFLHVLEGHTAPPLEAGWRGRDPLNLAATS